MIAVLLALVSAGLYGLSDFLSGVQSRKRSFLQVGLVAQCANAVCALTVALLTRTAPTVEGLAWGALAAVGTAVGTLFLMKGLAAGAMHVAGPVAAVVGAVLPVAVGALAGERPGLLALLGIALALPAVWLVASAPATDGADARAGLVEGVVAGLGFGLYFVGLAQPPQSAGTWPVAACQVLAVPLMAAWWWAARPAGTLRAAWPAWAVGVTGFSGSLAFLLASRLGMLTVVSVVTSLYPAVTVLLAVVLLGERTTRAQTAGLALAALAVGLVAAG